MCYSMRLARPGQPEDRRGMADLDGCGCCCGCASYGSQPKSHLVLVFASPPAVRQITMVTSCVYISRTRIKFYDTTLHNVMVCVSSFFSRPPLLFVSTLVASFRSSPIIPGNTWYIFLFFLSYFSHLMPSSFSLFVASLFVVVAFVVVSAAAVVAVAVAVAFLSAKHAKPIPVHVAFIFFTRARKFSVKHSTLNHTFIILPLRSIVHHHLFPVCALRLSLFFIFLSSCDRAPYLINHPVNQPPPAATGWTESKAQTTAAPSAAPPGAASAAAPAAAVSRALTTPTAASTASSTTRPTAPKPEPPRASSTAVRRPYIYVYSVYECSSSSSSSSSSYDIPSPPRPTKTNEQK